MDATNEVYGVDEVNRLRGEMLAMERMRDVQFDVAQVHILKLEQELKRVSGEKSALELRAPDREAVDRVYQALFQIRAVLGLSETHSVDEVVAGVEEVVQQARDWEDTAVAMQEALRQHAQQTEAVGIENEESGSGGASGPSYDVLKGFAWKRDHDAKRLSKELRELKNSHREEKEADLAELKLLREELALRNQEMAKRKMHSKSINEVKTLLAELEALKDSYQEEKEAIKSNHVGEVAGLQSLVEKLERELATLQRCGSAVDGDSTDPLGVMWMRGWNDFWGVFGNGVPGSLAIQERYPNTLRRALNAFGTALLERDGIVNGERVPANLLASKEA